MRDLLQISQMAVKQSRTNGQEVRVAWVVDLNDAPRILTSANLAATDFDNLLGSNYGKRHESSQFGILLDGVFVVFLNVIGEVVDGDPIVLDVLHDQLLGLGELSRCKRVRATNDGDDIHTGSEALHELDVQLTETTHVLDERL